MAKELRQTVAQYNLEGIDQRFLVQYSEDGLNDQAIVEYSSLTEEEKATFDAFKALCESKM
jgi:hypothetical protein